MISIARTDAAPRRINAIYMAVDLQLGMHARTRWLKASLVHIASRRSNLSSVHNHCWTWTAPQTRAMMGRISERRWNEGTEPWLCVAGTGTSDARVASGMVE